MRQEAGNAVGELYEIAGETPNTISTGDADAYSAWVTGELGILARDGSVQFDPNDKDTWDDATPYAIGAVVAHGGNNWTCIEQEYDAWDKDTTYSATDTVNHNGYDWVCQAESTGDIPEIGSSYWSVASIDDEPTGSPTFWEDSGERGDRLVIGLGGAGVYKVDARVLFSGDADSVFTWAVHLNESAVSKLSCAITAVDGVEHLAIISGLLALTEDDVVDLRVAGSVGSETVTILAANLLLERVSEV